MISEVFITCPVTGGGSSVGSPHVPITPEQIANSAIEATRAGAAVVHIHVRDPETRRGSGLALDSHSTPECNALLHDIMPGLL